MVSPSHFILVTVLTVVQHIHINFISFINFIKFKFVIYFHCPLKFATTEIILIIRDLNLIVNSVKILQI